MDDGYVKPQSPQSESEPHRRIVLLPSGQIATFIDAVHTLSSGESSTRDLRVELAASIDLNSCIPVQSKTSLYDAVDGGEQPSSSVLRFYTSDGQTPVTAGELFSITEGLLHRGLVCHSIPEENGKASDKMNETSIVAAEEVLDDPSLVADEGDENMNLTSDSPEDSCASANEILNNLPDVGKIYKMVSNADGSRSLVALDSMHLKSLLQGNAENGSDGDLKLVQLQTVQHIAPTVPRNLPPDCPEWAECLNDCERIGNSYRGWVETDYDLDTVLTKYKLATNTYWGTRQSLSCSKPSIRLMWKSQYVPFDGIPFVNTGSRATVMECQYGPRRKNNVRKSTVDESGLSQFAKVFTPTCPARIYIKKVRKFLDFSVDVSMEKKHLKVHMDYTFQLLKDCYVDKLGHERYYVQLPTEAAHEFHEDENQEEVMFDSDLKPLEGAVNGAQHRLHPGVSNKIRELVSGGEMRQFVIRNLLRRFVEKELFCGSSSVPERHDLTYYPTIHDLQNHIYHALRDIEDGILPFTAKSLTIENPSQKNKGARGRIPISANKWMENAIAAAEASADEPQLDIAEEVPVRKACVEAVTLTLAPPKDGEGQRTVTRVELRMSDGSSHFGSAIPHNIMQLVTSLGQSPKSEEMSEIDVDGCYQSAPEYNQANLPFLVAMETLANQESMPPCPLDRVVVECGDEELLEETVGSAGDHVYCQTEASTIEHPTDACQRLPGKSKKAPTTSDSCRAKQFKLEIFSRT